MTGTDTGRPAADLPADGLPAAQALGAQIPGARLPAGADPLAIDEQPLPVPPGAAAVDLADAFGKLLFRSAFAQRKRAEEAKEAESGLRDLLLGLLEVDDALGAIAGTELQPVAYPERLLGAPAPATTQAGAAATRRLLRLKLARAGVRPMSFDNRLANTDVSEIVATTPVAGMPEDTVVEVVQAGFFWQDQVLRRARVVVSVLPEELPAGPPEEWQPAEWTAQEWTAGAPDEQLAAGPDAPALSVEPAPVLEGPYGAQPLPAAEPASEPVPEPEPEPEPVPERPRPVRKQPKRQQSRAKRRTTAGSGTSSTGSTSSSATTASADVAGTDTSSADTGSADTGNTGS